MELKKGIRFRKNMDKQRRKGILACLLIFVVALGFSVPAIGGGAVAFAEENQVLIGNNVNEALTDENVVKTEYYITNGVMNPSNSSMLWFKYEFKINPTAKGVKSGDFITYELDKNMRMQGWVEKSAAKFPNLVDSSTNQIVATAFFDAANNTVKYVFTDYVEGKGEIQASAQAVVVVDEDKITNNGTYSFTNKFGNFVQEDTYKIEYESFPEPISNVAYGNKKELTTGRQLIKHVNPYTKRYEQIFVLIPKVTSDTITGRIGKRLGFDILGTDTPQMEEKIKVYRIKNAPDSISGSLNIEDSNLEEVTDQFTVTVKAGGAGLRYIPNANILNTDYYLVKLENGYDDQKHFNSGMTPVTYDENGKQLGDLALCSFGNTFTQDQLKALAWMMTTPPTFVKKLAIKKINTSGQSLKEADFAIYDGDNKVGSLSTNEQGEGDITLALKEYTLRETKAPNGYLEISDVKFEINKDGKLIIKDKAAKDEVKVEGDKFIIVDKVKPIIPVVVPATDTVSVKVQKTWNIKEGIKNPDSVIIVLEPTGQTIELNEKNMWKGEFVNLPKKNAKGEVIEYKIVEKAVPNYTSSISGSMTTGFIVTNTFVENPQNPSISDVEKPGKPNESKPMPGVKIEKPNGKIDIPNKSIVPKTGDDNTLLLYGGLISLSLMALAYMAVKRHKEESEK